MIVFVAFDYCHCGRSNKSVPATASHDTFVLQPPTFTSAGARSQDAGGTTEVGYVVVVGDHQNEFL